MINVSRVDLRNTVIPSKLFANGMFDHNWDVEIVRIGSNSIVLGYVFGRNQEFPIHVRFTINFGGTSLLIDSATFARGLDAISDLIIKYVQSIDEYEAEYSIADVMINVDRSSITGNDFSVKMTEDFY